MTEQAIYDPVLLISGRPKVHPRPWSNFKNCLFRLPLIEKRCAGNLRDFDKEFVSKIYHAEKKDEESISNTL